MDAKHRYRYPVTIIASLTDLPALFSGPGFCIFGAKTPNLRCANGESF
jgi:hypothetical protein